MKKSNFFTVILILISQLSFGQNQNQKFKIEGVNPISIAINTTYSESVEIFPFDKNGKPIFGLDASANIELNGDKALVRLLLIDNSFNEHLIYESYNLLLEEEASFSIKNICEETSILDNVKPYALQIEIKNAKLELLSLSYSTAVAQGKNIANIKKEKKKAQNKEKINRINKNLKKQKKSWIAGATEVSELNYSDRKKLYGQSTFPPGFEYYVGGVITASTPLKSVSTSMMVDDWDWRDRHGKNWISPVTNQGACGSCWAFATTGATEAMVNVFFNQQLNLDLSEQDVLSCSGAGDCDGGYPSTALNYITNTGVVDENAFPYADADLFCKEKGTNPSELIKIGGRIDFGSTTYPKTEDDLKRMLIEMGPVSGGLYDWSHAMVLVGYKVVQEGDVFYYCGLSLYRNWKTVAAGDPLIGKTVWIFKNSWGPYFGDTGYVYVETPITNIGWTHALKTPITSTVKNYEVICEDKDGDGYFWWGIGEKPATCTGPDLPDGNDSDPTLGPLDEYGNCILLNVLVAPAANFTADKIVITEGKTVSFSDVSTNNPVSWAWIFEGGNPTTSNLESPFVTYDLSGSFDVTLTVTNTSGSDTRIMENFMVVEEAASLPMADFTADEIEITESETVSFSDVSTNNPISWAWIFEGGNPATSNLEKPFVTYDSPGSFDVTLTVTNTTGSDTRIMESFMVVEEAASLPVADFTADKIEITESETVSFSDVSTNNPISWAWIFEGGNPTTSNLENPFVTYDLPGSFDVTLTVTNTTGSDTRIMESFMVVEEAAPLPVADFSANKTTVTEGETVTFSDLSTNNPVSWTWTFEGGNPTTSSAQSPSVTYSSSGTYKVTLKATNASGSDSKIVDNYIQVEVPTPVYITPVANFSADKTVITEGEDVLFADLSSNDPVSRIWEFEGGSPSTSTLKNPKITYNSSNNYKVKLTVSGTTGSDTKIIEDFITVEKYVPEFCTLSGNATNEWISSVQMGANSNNSGSGGYEDFTSQTFTFEAGKEYDIRLTPGFSARNKFEYWSVWIDFNGDKDFSDDGELVFSPLKSRAAVTGSITIPAGISIDTRIRVAMGSKRPSDCGFIEFGEVEDYSVHIGQPIPQPPIADFLASKINIQLGESVQFTDLSLNEPTSWLWSFSEGTPGSSNEQNPTFTFNSVGEYYVTLVVSKDGFYSSQKVELITVTENTVAEYCEPEAINSTLDYIENITIGNVLNVSTVGDNYSLSAANTITMSPGQNYPVSLMPHLSTTRNYWRIWIDFNGDGDFDDSDETVVLVNTKKGSIISSLVIPSNASGSTRMRISMRNSNTPFPCDDNFDGEVEDYLVSFEPASSPPKFASSKNPEAEIHSMFKIYPNPVNDKLNIQLNSTDQGDFYSIYNMNGEILITNQITSTQTNINFAQYSTGMYLVVVVNKDEVFKEKFIKR